MTLSHGHYPINPGVGGPQGAGNWTDSAAPLVVLSGVVGQSGSNFSVGTSTGTPTTPGDVDGLAVERIGSFGENFWNARFGVSPTYGALSSLTGTDLRVVIPEAGLDDVIAFNAGNQYYQGSASTSLWAALGPLLGQTITIELYDPLAVPAPDPDDGLWQPVAPGGALWSGVLGAIGVEFKVELALGGADGGAAYVYDDPTSVYDTATYSTNDVTWVDITGRVKDVGGRRGKNRLSDAFRPGQGTLEVFNLDGVFNPQVGRNLVGDQAMRPGRWVRLSGKRTDSDEWVRLWTMRLQALGDVYTDAAHMIVSRWQLVGLETILETNARPALEVPDPASAGQTSGERARYIWETLEDWIPELLVTPDTYDHTLRASTFPPSRYDQFKDAAEAEGGDFYVGRDGLFYFRGRDWLNPLDAAIFEVGDYDLTDVVVLDAQTAWDMTRLRNGVALTRAAIDEDDNPATQFAENTASQATYSRFDYVKTGLENDNDVDVSALAFRMADWFAWDSLRIERIEVWSPRLDGVNNLLNVELGDVVEVTIVTAQGWSYTIKAWVMEVEHTVTHTDWRTFLRLENTFRLDPRQAGPYNADFNADYDAVAP